MLFVFMLMKNMFFLTPLDLVCIDSEHPLNLSSQFILGNFLNPMTIFHESFSQSSSTKTTYTPQFQWRPNNIMFFKITWLLALGKFGATKPTNSTRCHKNAIDPYTNFISKEDTQQLPKTPPKFFGVPIAEEENFPHQMRLWYHILDGQYKF